MDDIPAIISELDRISRIWATGIVTMIVENLVRSILQKILSGPLENLAHLEPQTYPSMWDAIEELHISNYNILKKREL
jgi:hypothetical protein